MTDQTPGRTLFKCDDCQTTHSNEQDYNNHIVGKKHKRKVAMQTADIRNKARKLLCETKGVFIGNLPPNTEPNEILAYVGSFGKVEQWKLGSRFAKVLFSDEQSAANFKKRKHVLKGHVLRTNVWKFHVPAPGGGAKTEDRSLATHAAVAEALGADMDLDSEVAALQRVLLLPDRSSTCARLCADLTAALRPVCTDFSVHPFGSVATGLALVGSDVDVVVDNTFTLLEYERVGRATRQSFRIDEADMRAVAKALRVSFSWVMPIFGAKVPIIKCIHRSTHVNCDLSFTNVSAVQNSRLISWYLASDPRVKPFLIVVKYWAKFFELTKTCFTNYALVMLGLFYLMQLDDPIVPPVIQLQTNFAGRLYVDGWNVSFDPDHHFGESKNTSSIFDLLLGFFEFYACFDYGMNVLCPLIGKALPKVFFGHVKRLPAELTSCQLNPQEAEERLAALKIDCSMCVQDPFILDCNITKSIPQVAALRIQAICLTSVYVLKEARKDSTTGLLKQLLQKRTADLTLVPSLWNNKPSNHIEIKIVVGSYVPIVGPEATLNDAQNAWYNKALAVIMGIFENIFKFKLVEDLGSLNTQNMEVTGGKYSRTIICKSKGPDLRTNRKRVGKELLGSASDSTISFFEMQERITQYIIMAAQEAAIETVEFKCCFHTLRNPTHIIVELSDIASSEGVFGWWASYLVRHLADWSRTIMDAEKDTSEIREPTINSA